MPTVSVIVLYHTRMPWLEKALASVVAQTFTDWSASVVINTDNPFTFTQPLDSRITCFVPHCDHTKLGAARNAGASATDAPYILFLDGDDVLCPTALETLLRPLQRREHLSGAYGFPYIMNADGSAPNGKRPVGQHPRGGELHLADLVGNARMVAPPGSALLRRSAFDACGGWDETGTVRESVEIFQRLLRVGPMACIPQAVIGYRQHPGQISKVRNKDAGQMAATEAKLNALLNS